MTVMYAGQIAEKLRRERVSDPAATRRAGRLLAALP